MSTPVPVSSSHLRCIAHGPHLGKARTVYSRYADSIQRHNRPELHTPPPLPSPHCVPCHPLQHPRRSRVAEEGGLHGQVGDDLLLELTRERVRHGPDGRGLRVVNVAVAEDEAHVVDELVGRPVRDRVVVQLLVDRPAEVVRGTGGERRGRNEVREEGRETGQSGVRGGGGGAGRRGAGGTAYPRSIGWRMNL